MEWGYLLLLISAVFLCAMSAVRKEYQRRVDATLKSTLIFMGVSSFFICLIGVIYCCFTDFKLIKEADSFVVGLSVAFAVILTVNTCVGIFGAKYGSLAVLIMFATLGTLVISTVYGLITDPVKNQLNGFTILGLCLVVGIIILSFVGDRLKIKETGETEKQNKKSGKVFIVLCLAAFLFNGVALSAYSLFTSDRPNYGGFNFIFLYLFFCVLICLLVLTILFWVDKKKKRLLEIKKYVSGKALVLSIVYGVVFFLSEFCALTTTSILPIVIQAPLSFAMNVVMVAIVDYLLYKQKLTKIQLIQIGLAIISGICFVL